MWSKFTEHPLNAFGNFKCCATPAQARKTAAQIFQCPLLITHSSSAEQIEICAGHLRCLRNLRNLVSEQADLKFARVCASPRKYLNK